MRPSPGVSISLILGIALVGLSLVWLGPRPVYDLWVAEELAAGQELDSAALEPLIPAGAASAAPLHLLVVDLDGDGRDDLVHIDRARAAAMAYRNQGGAGLSPIPAAEIAAAAGSLAGPTARRGGRGLTWEEVRAADPEAESARPPWAGRALFFDADLDGDLDGIAAETGAEASLRFYMLLEPGYREISARLGPAWTTRRVISDLACGDFNADGLVDVVLARPGSPPVVLWNRFARP